MCLCVQAPSPCALDRTAAWLLNMNSTSSYGEAEDDRHDDSLVEKVRFSKFWVNTGSTGPAGSDGMCVCAVPAGDCVAAGEVAHCCTASGGV